MGQFGQKVSLPNLYHFEVFIVWALQYHKFSRRKLLILFSYQKVPYLVTPFGYFYKANIFLTDKQLTESKINSNKE